MNACNVQKNGKVINLKHSILLKFLPFDLKISFLFSSRLAYTRTTIRLHYIFSMFRWYYLYKMCMHRRFLHKVYNLICNSFGGETVGDQKSFWLYSQQGAYWFFFYSLFSYYTFVVVIYTKSQTHPSLNITCRIIRKTCNKCYCHDSTDKSLRLRIIA